MEKLDTELKWALFSSENEAEMRSEIERILEKYPQQDIVSLFLFAFNEGKTHGKADLFEQIKELI